MPKDKIIPGTTENKTTQIPIDIIPSVSAFLSNENRITDSPIFKKITGTTIIAIVEIKSTVPYCSVESADVYSGTRKKLISLVPKFPKENINVFFTKYFFRFIPIVSPYPG